MLYTQIGLIMSGG